MAALQIDGITIEYDERGAGAPLLLVMGLGGQLIDWPEGLLDALAQRGFRVITFDNRDSGLSTEIDAPAPTRAQLAATLVRRRRSTAPYLLSHMAADAVGLLDSLGLERAHVVGMSMGGMIAQQIAIDHSHRVASLTSIMSTTGDRRVGQPKLGVLLASLRRGTPSAAEAVDQGMELFRRVCGPTFDEAEFRELAERAVARSYRPAGTARQTQAILASPNRTPALQRLTMRSLVIHGMLDPLVRPSGGVATARAIPGARLVMFNDMAHDLPRNRFAEIADEIAAISGVTATAEPSPANLASTSA